MRSESGQPYQNKRNRNRPLSLFPLVCRIVERGSSNDYEGIIIADGLDTRFDRDNIT